MLHLIEGRSGSGKTQWLHQKLMQQVQKNDRKNLILVPEQYTFETERSLLKKLGEQEFSKIQVTSFTRLSELVFRQTGGLAGRRLNDGGRAILMSLALDEVRDRLFLYRRQSSSVEMVHLMLEAEKELKTCSLLPSGLSEAAHHLEKGNLQKKMEEAALILETYEALVQRSYIDPMDDLTRLAETLREFPVFKGYSIWIDAFSGFTGQEKRVLECLMTQSEEIYLSLCMDGMKGRKDPLFSSVYQTEREVKQIAREHGIKIADPICLEAGKRFSGKGLRTLEVGLYRQERERMDTPASDVFLYEAATPYEEADYVARTIRRLVIENGYRYRDFEVIARSTETYQGILDRTFEKYEIPFFMDAPEMIDAKPLMNLVLSAFDILHGGWNSDDVFHYLKTGLAGLDTEEISLLENYILLWSLSGKKWKEPFSGHPDGFSPEWTEKDKQRLAQLENLRLRTVEPLRHLEARMQNATGSEAARGIYRLLEEIHTAEHLKEFSLELERDGKFGLAEEQLRLWDMLMEILDQTALVLGDHPIPSKRYAELLRLVINSGDISFIPQGLDQVTVGTADRTRSCSPKVVFLIGAVEGEFPRTPIQSGIFSDAERRLLIQMGLPLYDSLEQLAMEERYLAYLAIASPSERLFVSYPSANISGSAKMPSSLIREIRRLLPHQDIQRADTLELSETIWAAQPAFEQAARLWSSRSLPAQTLKRYFQSHPAYVQKWEALQRAALARPIQFERSETARRLFGDRLKVSASQVEKYYLCRFQYFCRYGLRAKERKPAAFDALEYGSLMHYLLEQTLRSHTPEQWKSFTSAQVKQEIQKYLEEYVQIYLGGWEDKTPRFRFLFTRLASTAELLLTHIVRELSQSEFQPEDYELRIQEGCEIQPLVIALPGGGSVEIEGKVDRVDVMRRHGNSYVRVIDYKTGSKEFRLSDVLYGLNMQMLLYLAAIWKNGGERYGNVVPAGVLYMPANRPVINSERGDTEEKVIKEQDKKLRMSGLVLDDPEVISGMEHKAQGVFIPVALKDGRPAKLDAVANFAQMGHIVKYMESLVVKMAMNLQKGDIAAVPTSGEYEACEWCPYRSVCRHEDGGNTRIVEKWDREQVMKRLEEEEK